MRVVVGKQQTQTPIFSEQMTHLVFSPYWNVPPDIAKNETLPSVLKDSGFLDRTNMEIVDRSGNPVDAASIDLSGPGQYRFRQRPGVSNSLGLVKFMFPNQFNVYLHDTPADSLFARASRAFSHGCVRLEQPGKLAEYVLRDQPDWTPERIGEAMQGGQERTVRLKAPLPVYIGYWTASVSADGLVQFRKDIYGSDSRLTARVAERLPRLRAGAMDRIERVEPEPDGRHIRTLDRQCARRARHVAQAFEALRELIGRQAFEANALKAGRYLSHLREQLVEIDGLRQVGIGVDLLDAVLAGRRHHDHRDVGERRMLRPARAGTASRP